MHNQMQELIPQSTSTMPEGLMEMLYYHLVIIVKMLNSYYYLHCKKHGLANLKNISLFLLTAQCAFVQNADCCLQDRA